jgi:hypothetical protein
MRYVVLSVFIALYAVQAGSALPMIFMDQRNATV